VGLLARSGFIERAEHAAASDPLTKAFARPSDEEALRWQLEQLAALAPREFVDFDTRQRQAVKALDLLAQLACSSGKLYDLRRVQGAVLKALYVPKLSAKAVEILACFNSAESQRALVDVASNLGQPIPLRQAAVKAFRLNSEKHGILLTSEEIREQYRRYNASETADAGTQQVLGLILNCIEAPTQAQNAKE
jgi:hypothetical protein